MLRSKIYETMYKDDTKIHKTYKIPNIGTREFSIKCCTNNFIFSLLQPICQEEPLLIVLSDTVKREIKVLVLKLQNLREYYQHTSDLYYTFFYVHYFMQLSVS